MLDDNLIEVRVPTYRRPHLLRRCLTSLLNQSFHNWSAVVLDDSGDSEAKNVVQDISDERIIYRQNPQQLGCCGNIDAAFAPSPYMGGTWAMVLEDDNWLLPECLKSNLKIVQTHDCQVLLRNQTIVHDDGSTNPRQFAGNVQDEILGTSDRVYEPLAIQAATTVSTGISNGGLFWKLQPYINFVVGPTVQHSPMQEFCRTLRLNQNLVYAAEPLAMFSLPLDSHTTRESLSNRSFNRGKQAIIRHLLQVHRPTFAAAFDDLPLSPEKRIAGTHSLADALHFSRQTIHLRYILAQLKGLYKLVLVNNPIDAFLIQRELAAIPRCAPGPPC